MRQSYGSIFLLCIVSKLLIFVSRTVTLGAATTAVTASSTTGGSVAGSSAVGGTVAAAR